ncbi:MAG: hypothetical protein RL653_588 [Pseudomonadota bacterium]|jgi:hypothetical protein
MSEPEKPTPPAASSAPAPRPASSVKPLLIVLGVVALLGFFALAAAGIGAYFFFRSRSDSVPALVAVREETRAPPREVPPPPPPPPPAEEPEEPFPMAPKFGDAEDFDESPGAHDEERVKPSFPCEKATTATELAICNTPELARLDVQLAKLYSENRVLHPEIKKAQLAFLGRMNRCAGDTGCIQSLQSERMGELEALASGDVDTRTPSVALGRAIHLGTHGSSAGCNACHSLDGNRLVGPSFKGWWGSQVNTSSGTVTADAAYARESILRPIEKVTEGYPPAMPPYEFNEVELESILLFLKDQAKRIEP